MGMANGVGGKVGGGVNGKYNEMARMAMSHPAFLNQVIETNVFDFGQKHFVLEQISYIPQPGIIETNIFDFEQKHFVLEQISYIYSSTRLSRGPRLSLAATHNLR